MNKFFLFISISLITTFAQAQSEVTFKSNNTGLNQAFNWAKNKALSFAHDGSDPVGYWYEAALPNREAFCMRDVSHQAIGAEILGLSKHNANMFQKFAENISAEKDYCSYWEINRYNKPAPVDYENDKDFWYNLPANFDVIYNAHRLYNWTGDKNYLENPAFKKFYSLSMNEYVDHWDLGFDEITMPADLGLTEASLPTTKEAEVKLCLVSICLLPSLLLTKPIQQCLKTQVKPQKRISICRKQSRNRNSWMNSGGISQNKNTALFNMPTKRLTISWLKTIRPICIIFYITMPLMIRLKLKS